MSESALTVLGYPPSEWIAADDFLLRHVHPDDAERAATHLGAAIGGATDAADFRMVADDGRAVWMHDVISATRERDGAMLLRGLMIDVTALKLTEENARENEERLRRAQSAANVGTWDWDIPTGSVIWDGVEAIHGLAPGAFAGTFDAYARDIHEADREHVLAAILSAAEAGGEVDLEYRIRLPDGRLRWVSGKGRAFRDDAGNVTRMAGTCTDVTRRKSAELSLERRERELAEFFENAPVGMHWTGPDGTILRVNRAELELLGYTRDEYVGRHVSEFHADVRTSEDLVARLRRGETLVDYQARLRCKDGSIRDVVIDSNVLWEDGEFVHSRCFTRDVTDQKRSEQDRATSVARYRMLAEAMPALVVTILPDGAVGYSNRRFFEYTGLASDDMPRDALREIFHPDDFDAVSATWRTTIERGEFAEGQLRLRRADGVYRWHLGRTAPIRAEDGRAGGWVITAIDIDDRKRAEDRALALNAALERRLNELQTVLDVVPVGIGIARDPECRSIVVNPAFARMLGISPAANASMSAPDADALPFRVLEGGSEMPAEQLPMQRAAAEGVTISDLEVDLVRDDGRRFSLLEYAAPIFDASGRPAGSVGAFVDITERQRIETSQRFLLEAGALLSSSLDYETTLQSLARLSVPYVADWCAVDVLEGEGRLRRLAVAHPDPRKVDLAQELHERHPSNLNVEFGVAAVLRTGLPDVQREIPDGMLAAIVEDEDDLRTLRSLGLVSSMCLPLIAHGRMLGAITFVSAESGRRFGDADLALAEDLARRAALAIDTARLFSETQRATRDLMRANEAKDEFLGLVSHELRTPITTIFGNAQVLRTRATQLDEQSRILAITDIEQEAERLHRIVENMLVLARVEAGSGVVTEPLLLQHVLGRIITSHRHSWSAHEVVLNADPDLPPVAAEPVYFEQIMHNLLSNADKYSPPGAPIVVRVTRDGHEAVISVLDEGAGIDPDEAERIFSAFYRSSRTSRQASGAGIGLAVCKRLVEAQSGRIWARPREGGGSALELALPFVREALA